VNKNAFIALIQAGISVIWLGFSQPVSAFKVDFNLTGTNSDQETALGQAAQIWENILLDDIIVNINISFADMGSSSIIGGTSSTLYYADFGDVKNQLNIDRTSDADTSAVGYINALPTTGLGENLSFWSNSPSGEDDLLYASSDIFGTQANLKALGYTGFTGPDASVEFNTKFAFDYDRSDGIDSLEMDFVGVAAHEIGHALGFVSSVDSNLWYYQNYGYDNALPPSILDLYRHTDEHGAGEIDISYDGSDGWFSYDTALIIDMSDGGLGSDGRQASHWADYSELGMMDPTASYGELLDLTYNDILAFDVVGYDVISTPGPASMLLLGSGLVVLAGFRRKFKK